ncbi:MAG: PQQ-binding-like beta-propeller repeat protein [Planctomycetes bacterium]|nr:PQQ-binding-like beta-propeller repeat protein [Planctomycetota bacterium]
MFRGNARLTGVATAALPDKLSVRWKREFEEAFQSSAAIVDGVVYVGCDDEHLYALSLATGKTKWRYKATGPIHSSPTVIGGAVYFGDEMGIFHAVDLADGSLRWTFETLGEIISSAVPVGDRLLFGSYDGTLYCLATSDTAKRRTKTNPQTPRKETKPGKTGDAEQAAGAGQTAGASDEESEPTDERLIWKLDTEGRIHGTPGITGAFALIAGCDGQLHVVRHADGASIRTVGLGAVTGASAAIVDSSVYVGTYGETVVGLDWVKGEVDWVYTNPEKQFPYLSSAAVAGDLVVIGGRDKTIHGLDRRTGKSRWAFATKGRVDSSPVIVGDRVFIGSSDGNLYALAVATGRQTWRYETGSPITASPAVASGCLVIGTLDGVLYCFSDADTTGKINPSNK